MASVRDLILAKGRDKALKDLVEYTKKLVDEGYMAPPDTALLYRTGDDITVSTTMDDLLSRPEGVEPDRPITRREIIATLKR